MQFNTFKITGFAWFDINVGILTTIIFTEYSQNVTETFHISQKQAPHLERITTKLTLTQLMSKCKKIIYIL